MDINFLEEIQPCIMDRLGRIYNRDSDYKKSIKKETELFNQLEENLTENQIQLVKSYQGALCATLGICEMLSYRQGMRDLAGILGIEGKGEE